MENIHIVKRGAVIALILNILAAAFVVHFSEKNEYFSSIKFFLGFLGIAMAVVLIKCVCLLFEITDKTTAYIICLFAFCGLWLGAITGFIPDGPSAEEKYGFEEGLIQSRINFFEKSFWYLFILFNINFFVVKFKYKFQKQTN